MLRLITLLFYIALEAEIYRENKGSVRNRIPANSLSYFSILGSRAATIWKFLISYIMEIHVMIRTYIYHNID